MVRLNSDRLSEEDPGRHALVVGVDGAISRPGTAVAAACELMAIRWSRSGEVAAVLSRALGRRQSELLSAVVVGPAVGRSEVVRLARALGVEGELSPVFAIRSRLDRDEIDLLLGAGCCDCLDATASVDDIVRALRLAFEVARRQRAEALWLEPEEGPAGWPPPALLEARQLAATGRTFLGVVHDLRNLVQPVLGYAELLSSETTDAASRVEFSRAIVELATEFERLLSRALEMRPGQSAPVEVEADLVISRLESLIRAVAGPRIQVDLAMGGAGARIRVRPGALEQVVLNLAANSKEAMPEGGRLRLETSMTASGWSLGVADTGIGMPPSRLGELFEPGRASPRRGGAGGLGLWIVRALIEEIRGTIRVQSEEGVGTRVAVFVPGVPSADDAG